MTLAKCGQQAKPFASEAERARAARAAHDGDAATLRALAAVKDLGVNEPVMRCRSDALSASCPLPLSHGL